MVRRKIGGGAAGSIVRCLGELSERLPSAPPATSLSHIVKVLGRATDKGGWYAPHGLHVAALLSPRAKIITR